jgi:hypothetical protein
VIRIFRSRTGDSFRGARDRTPDLVAADLGDLFAAIERGTPGFSARELATLRLALDGVSDYPDADVVLAGDGVLYNVVSSDRPVEVVPAEPRKAEDVFSKTGGRVLLLEPRPELRAVMRDALEVIGFETDAFAPLDGEAIALALRQRRPEIVLVSEGEHAPRPAALVAGAAAPLASVLVAPPPPPLAAGWDAVTCHPLKVEGLAAVLDPLVTRVRLLRGA